MANQTNTYPAGIATAYGAAVRGGYTGTYAEFCAQQAQYAENAAAVAQAKEDAQAAAATAGQQATAAGQSATAAAGSATAAAGSAGDAAGSATAAAGSATTAGSKATEAAASATAAGQAQTAAEAAQTAAETAQGAAEDAAESVEGKAAQIDQNTSDISLLKSHFDALPDDGVTANAKQLLTDKGITESVPYLFRRSGGDGADREFDTVVGGTVAWNQLLQAIQSKTENGITGTQNANGTYTVNGTATGVFESYRLVPLYPGHVYMFVGVPSGASDETYYSYWLNTKRYKDMVYKRPTDAAIASTSVSVIVPSGSTVSNITFKLQVFDLTKTFGSTIADYIYSLETAHAGDGVAFFRNLFPAEYYPYDSGSLKSVEGVSAHVTTEFNLFDKSTSVSGAITADGSIGANPNRTVSDWIKALPNTDYYVVGIVPASDGRGIALYDSGKGYIKTVSPAGASTLTSGTFTTTADTAYIRIGMLNTSVNDACLNFSNPAKNGQYEPYNAHTYALDDSLTLRGIPKLDSNNALYYDGDTYASDGTVTRRYGVYTFTGSENWSASSMANRYSVTLTSGVLPNCGKPTTTTDALQNIISSKYGRFVYKNEDKVAYGYATSNDGLTIVANDSSIATVGAMKTAMAGTILIYELATPTTEEAEPFQSPQICSPYGTEEYITTGIVPVGHSTFYPENLRAKIEELPSNFSTLIAPTESAFVATRNYTIGALFIVSNVLYKATANIANGGTITPGTNCTATTLAEIISALA